MAHTWLRVNVAYKHVTPFTFAFQQLYKPRFSQCYGHSVVSTVGMPVRITTSITGSTFFSIFTITYYSFIKEDCSCCFFSSRPFYLLTRLFMGYRDTQLLGVKGACKQPESDRNHWEPISWLHHACNSKQWYQSKERLKTFGECVFAPLSLSLCSSHACSPLTSVGIYRVNYFWVFYKSQLAYQQLASSWTPTLTSGFQKTG